MASMDGLVRQRHADHEAAAAGSPPPPPDGATSACPYEEAQALLGQGRYLVALGRASRGSCAARSGPPVFARGSARACAGRGGRAVAGIPA